MLETANPEGHIACSAAVRDFDSCEQLGKIRVPTLVISGTRDPVTTPADGRFLADHIPGARYVDSTPRISVMSKIPILLLANSSPF